MTARASGARRFRETQASDDDDDDGDDDGDDGADDDLFDGKPSEARPGRPSFAEMVPQCEQARHALRPSPATLTVGSGSAQLC